MCDEGFELSAREWANISTSGAFFRDDVVKIESRVASVAVLVGEKVEWMGRIPYQYESRDERN